MVDYKKNMLEILLKISEYDGNETTLLVALVNVIRASKKQMQEGQNEDFDDLVFWVTTYPDIGIGLKKYIVRLCGKKEIVHIITEANMVSGTAFFTELWDRIILKFLPEHTDRNSAEAIISDVFYKENDGKWIAQLSKEKCIRLVEVLGIQGMHEKDNQDGLIQDLLFAIKVLSHRISGYALDAGIIKLVPEYAHHNNPFIALNNEINDFIADIDIDNSERSEDDINYKQTLILLAQCSDYIQKAYQNIPEFGISFKVHQQLMMVEKMLERLYVAIDLIVVKNDRSSQAALVDLCKSLVSFTAGKSQITDYVNKSTQIYAREITRNIAIKGEQYITTSVKDYWKMLRAALGGGAIVAIACMVKLKMGSIETSLLVKAFYYSMNYSVAFIAIYLLHLTLATKQPAMTAATLAKNIDNDKERKDGYEQLAALVSRVWRTQFIAFVGNVFMAFPVALAIIASWFWVFGENAAEMKAHYLIGDLNIFTSPAILHAAIAGVFLFISGLIAGNISNRNKVKHIPQRIIAHPVLKQITTLNIRTKIAAFIDYYWAGIVSNFWFGVFMGSVGTVGVIIGLDLDIRHITFAAGNFALGLYGYEFQMSGYDIFHSILGIGVIGFVNFSVSFALSLVLALRSRGIKLSELSEVIRAIKNRFSKNPLSFFYPQKR